MRRKVSPALGGVRRSALKQSFPIKLKKEFYLILNCSGTGTILRLPFPELSSFFTKDNAAPP